MELLNELENVVNLTYWEHGHKGIFLFQDGLCAHIKMSREKFDEIQDKYYGNKLKNIISDSGIKNKQNRKKESIGKDLKIYITKDTTIEK